MSDLLSANIVHTKPQLQVLLDGRLVHSPKKKKNRRRVEGIGSCCEAFAIFTLILTLYFPHRWKDLTNYKLLILRTYRQFSGRVWLAYDKAFREQVAAARVVDWSTLNVQLYNFCAAGASVRGGFDSAFNDLPEPSGAAFSYAGRGTEVVLPPNQCLVPLLIVPAIVMVPIELVPVLPIRIMRPNRIGNASLLRCLRVHPPFVPNAFDGLPLPFV